MLVKKIFNADDFGISHGVNQAIAKAYHEGILNSTSLMVNVGFVKDAMELKNDMPDLNVGLHLNLTNEYAVSESAKIPLLVDENGKFKNGFVALLMLSLTKPDELRQQVEIETKAQIEKAQRLGIKLSHIDSHRHIHHIPLIFQVVRKLVREYSIQRIRIMNESIFNTLRHNRDFSFLTDGGLIKYFVLRGLVFWNNYDSDVYFYSILYTCKLSKERLKGLKIPSGFRAIEVAVHPGIPEVDKNYPADIFDDNILSPWRTVELEMLLDKKIVKEITD